jgi:hypothetical protein
MPNKGGSQRAQLSPKYNVIGTKYLMSTCLHQHIRLFEMKAAWSYQILTWPSEIDPSPTNRSNIQSNLFITK